MSSWQVELNGVCTPAADAGTNPTTASGTMTDPSMGTRSDAGPGPQNSDGGAAGTAAVSGTGAAAAAGSMGVNGMGSPSSGSMPSSSNGMSGAGMPGVCSPRSETCDGTDEDCDGLVDEALEMNCGPSLIGVCVPGKQMCTAGAWSECIGATEAQPEICDAEQLDENCDGTSNEGCECAAGATMPCGSDVGACQKGMQVCTPEGVMSPICEGEVSPQEEVCDVAGEDENCDGSSNEQCECVPGEKMECGSDVGACKKGTKACTELGKFPTSCEGEVRPKTEICDGNEDDDCNGVSDDEDCECINGKTMDCTTSGIGVCAMGKKTCTNGQWGSRCEPMRTNCVCDDEAAPRACPGGSDVGECQAGTQRCVNGQWATCEGERKKDSREECDGVDGDCDGVDDADDDTTCGSNERCNGSNCEAMMTTASGLANYNRRCSSDADCPDDGICSNAFTPNFCSPRANDDDGCPPLSGFDIGVFYQTGCVILCPSGTCPDGMSCRDNPFMEPGVERFCTPSGTNGGL